MNDLPASGLIVDLILGAMVVEALVLAAHYRRTGAGVPPIALCINLAAGGGLLLALRAALADASWPWIAAALGSALVAHLADLRYRWSPGPAIGVSSVRDGSCRPTQMPH